MPRGALENSEDHVGFDGGAVGEPGEREPLRLGLELGLVPVLRDVLHERHAQEPRLLVFSRLALEAEGAGALAERLRNVAGVGRPERLGKHVLSRVGGDADRRLDDLAVRIVREPRRERERLAHRHRAAHRERVDVAQKSDALGHGELGVRHGEQLLEAVATIDGAVVADLAVVREHPGRATAGRARRRHRARGARQQRAGSGVLAPGLGAGADGDLPRLRGRALGTDRQKPLLRECELPALARRALEAHLQKRHAGLIQESRRTRPPRRAGSPPRSRPGNPSRFRCRTRAPSCNGARRPGTSPVRSRPRTSR